jgi:hypothetical protein
MRVPATDAVAFNCVLLSAVPYVMAAGGGQAMVDATWPTVMDTVAVEPR